VDSSVFLTQVSTVNETVPFTGTWTARTGGDVATSDTDTAVAIAPEPAAADLAASATLLLAGAARCASRRFAPAA
jgi:hypothetical protein